MKKKGFTLIELLIVVAIIAILAAIIFVALDPLRRFQDSRDSVRWQQASEIAHAIALDQVDNGGAYLAAIEDMVTSTQYMIVDGGMDIGCDNHDNVIGMNCNVGDDTDCVDLSGLVTAGKLGDIPTSPAGAVTWDDGSADGENGTGYTLERTAGGIVVRACEAENSDPIEILR